MDKYYSVEMTIIMTSYSILHNIADTTSVDIL